ncbi:hypothetical protein QFC21_001625 [Naganishia friedmannii]|uniref:Uncharacterized protein n=1 Tax=Naganishia friedmannii TaxID=89922 RepID=A0ACC2W1K0_9TREE|nr:hypothetical protein QFC21_001625 [Naganishia friedmannii]
MAKLDDLPAEIIDIIADFILVLESALTRVSRYLRNVLFEARFVRMVSMRDSHAWSQARHAQYLKERVRRYIGLPAILQEHPGLVKLELSWHRLAEDDFRLKCLQTGEGSQARNRSRRGTSSQTLSTVTLENLVEFHLRLQDSTWDTPLEVHRQFHSIMLKLRMPNLRHLHISSRFSLYLPQPKSFDNGWPPLMAGIEAGNYDRLEIIELCLDFLVVSMEVSWPWRRMLEDLVRHFSTRLAPPRIILRIFCQAEHKKYFERQVDGTMSLSRQYVPTESDVKTFTSEMPNTSSVAFTLHLYGYRDTFKRVGPPLRLLSVEKSIGNQTPGLQRNKNDESNRANGLDFDYSLDHQNMVELYNRVLPE